MCTGLLCIQWDGVQDGVKRHAESEQESTIDFRDIRIYHSLLTLIDSMQIAAQGARTGASAAHSASIENTS